MAHLVRLEVNAGRSDAVEFRVRNCAVDRLQGVTLALEGQSVELGEIAAGESRLPVVAAAAGSSVELVVDNHVYRGRIDLELNIHRLESYAGNDLAGMLRSAGDERELNEDRVRERIARGEPWWVDVGLELDEAETSRRSTESRSFFCVPDAPCPARASKALLESADPAEPRRIFLYSSPEVRFGRNTQKNDAVLRFLPDFFGDERSKTISSEQFVARSAGEGCTLTLSPQGRAPLTCNGKVVEQGKQLPLATGDEIRIGAHEFTLRVYCEPRTNDHGWLRTRELALRLDPGDDHFAACPWDFVSFSRTANGPEEEYCWLFRKADIGWAPGAGLRLGQPGARLSFWNGRYYVEATDPAREVKVGGRRLLPREAACLGTETEIALGTRTFRWTLVQA